MRRSLCTLWALALLALLLAGAYALGAQSAQPYRANFVHAADIIINRSLKLAPGEKVLLHSDPSRDPELAAAVRTAVVKAGGGGAD